MGLEPRSSNSGLYYNDKLKGFDRLFNIKLINQLHLFILIIVEGIEFEPILLFMGLFEFIN
jgi:hypothetical protein